MRSPPRLSRAILRALLPRHEVSEALEGDLIEGFARRASRSPARARWWFRWQVLTLPYLALHRETRRLHRGREAGPLVDPSLRPLWAAARGLRRTPGVAGLSVFTLAVGIGAVTSTVALVDQVALRPLPYDESHRLVAIQSVVSRQGPGEVWGLSEAAYHQFARESRSIEAIGLADNLWIDGEVTLAVPGGAVRVPADSVTAGLFDVLGARPAMGRLFTEREDIPGAPLVIVLSHEIWVTHFGEDPGVVGRTLTVDGVAREVVGVMEAGFRLPGEEPAAWVPLRLDPSALPENEHSLNGFARLRPGATVADAQAELSALTSRFPETLPEAYDDAFLEEWRFGTRVLDLREFVVGNVARALWTVAAGVGLIFLLALTNVTNLFLLRTEVRRNELAVRVAYGASRRGLAWEGWADGVVVSGGGVALGLGLTHLTLALQPFVAPGALPRVEELGLNGAAVGLAVFLGLVASIVVGVLPPLLTRVDPGALRQGGKGQTTSAGRLGTRQALVGAQIAIALVLLAGAGLMGRSFAFLVGEELGFDRGQVLAFQVALPAVRYGTSDASVAFYRDFVDRLEAIPGVVAAGGATELPFRQPDGCFATYPDGRAVERGEAPPCLVVVAATPGYLEALGARVTGGGADWAGVDAGTADVVVTAAAGAQLWPGANPAGRTLRGWGWGDAPPYRVAGVVGDLRTRGVDREPLRAVFLPLRPQPGTPLHWGPFWGAERELHMIVRASGVDPVELTPAIRALLTEMDPDVAPGPFETMVSLVSRSESVARTRLLMSLLGAAAILSLFLSAVGLFGVVSFYVRARTREIGLRIALGGRATTVAGSVLRQALWMAAIGGVAGVLGALAGTRMLRSFLYEVEPNDPLTLVAVVLVLLPVTVLAAWLPARRATRIQPMDALRE